MASNGMDGAHFVKEFQGENPNTTMALLNTSTTKLLENNFTEYLEFQKYVSLIVPPIFGIISVLGLLGNSLVIVVVLIDERMKNSMNILIVSLAFADLLFVIFCVPSTAASYSLTVWPLGDLGCKIVNYVLYVGAYASVYTLVMMSLFRFLIVVYPIRSRIWTTERNTWTVLTVMWFVILSANTPILFEWTEIEYQFNGENRTTCISQFSIKSERGNAFFGCFFFLGYVFPLGTISLFYGIMLKSLICDDMPGQRNQSTKRQRSKKQVTRMVIIVVVIFALCWLPIQIILFWTSFVDFPRTISFIAFQMAANCLCYLNSCINPILYTFLSQKFRNSFRRFLCCCQSFVADRASSGEP